MSTSSITAAVILDLARFRHPLFAELRVPDGALLHAMNARQRALLLMHGGAIEGLISTTVQMAMPPRAGLLLGNDGNVPFLATDLMPGWPEHQTTDDVPWVDFSEPPLPPQLPATGTTYADGWPTHLTDDGVPWVDFSEVPIAGDPFGTNGGTPGFPLPTDFLKLIAVSCVLADNRQWPIHVIAEAERFATPRTGPTAFVSGNRIVPLREKTTGNVNDVWSAGITAIQLSYVALPVLTSLRDPIMLPAPLHEALIAGVAETLAFSTTTLSPSDKNVLSIAARRAEAAIDAFSVSMVDTAQVTSIQFRG